MLLLLACVAPSLDPDPPAPAPAAPAEAPALVINELMSDNESVVMTAALEFADWVELYNAGPDPIDLARVGVTDAVGAAGWTGSGTLGPRERRLLWATGEAGPDTLPFRIAAEGDAVVLTWDGAPIDRIRTGPLPADTAWARFPDGGAWAVTARPTPAAPNGARPTDTIDPSDALFDPATVHAVDLVLSDAALASLDADPYTQVVGALGFEGAWFGRVGVSIKGGLGSLRSPRAKMALKIDLDDYEGHALRGLEHLTLNNLVQDPTGVREAVSYAFLREMGVPAPRTGWVRLSLNGEDRGLHLLVETPDDHFLARWFDDPTGRLWEGAYGVDLQPGGVEGFEYDSGPPVPDTSGLAAVATLLDEAPTDAAIGALDALVNVDQVLDVLAFEAVALHWDGYTTANNYRLYEDPTSGRVHLLPWGLDQAWTDIWIGPWGGRGRLFTFCIANAGCRARYDEALIRWAEAVDAHDLVGDVEALLPLVRAQLETDPYFETDLATHEAYVESTLRNMREWPPEVRAEAEADLE